MANFLSEPEINLIREVAQDAMILGWNQSIEQKAREWGVNDLQIRQLLDEGVKHNDEADPSARIEELADWKVEKQTNSRRIAPKGPGRSPSPRSGPSRDDEKDSKSSPGNAQNLLKSRPGSRPTSGVGVHALRRSRQ